MSSRTDYREHGGGAPLPSTGDWITGLLAVLTILTLCGFMAWADDRDRAVFAAREAAAEHERTVSVERMRAAYEQGQADALAGLDDDANGLQVAATCLAWLHVQGNKRALVERVCR